MKQLTVKAGMSKEYNLLYCIVWKRWDEMFNRIRNEQKHKKTMV